MALSFKQACHFKNGDIIELLFGQLFFNKILFPCGLLLQVYAISKGPKQMFNTQTRLSIQSNQVCDSYYFLNFLMIEPCIASTLFLISAGMKIKETDIIINRYTMFERRLSVKQNVTPLAITNANISHDLSDMLILKYLRVSMAR